VFFFVCVLCFCVGFVVFVVVFVNSLWWLWFVVDCGCGWGVCDGVGGGWVGSDEAGGV
jgi:hypothetical protein